jgi:iron complex outermembrane recepter protein
VAATTNAMGGFMMMRGRIALPAGALLGLSALASSALGESVPELSTIVVTATRIAESSLDLPVSVDRVGEQAIQEGQLQVNLSESLITVPGVSV